MPLYCTSFFTFHLISAQVLDPLDPSGAAFRKGLRELRDICGTRAILPTSYALSPQPLVTDPNPFASGGFADAYRGTLNGSGVCIKRLRMYRINGPQKVTEVSHSHDSSLRLIYEGTGLLQRGCRVETLGTPKHCTTIGHYCRSFAIRFRMDVRTGSAGIY